MSLRLAGTALVALTLLSGCGRQAAPAAPRAAAAPEAASLKITPEQAEEKARKQARSWNAGAELVGVVWAVPKLELAGITFHLFRAPDADAGLFAVETRGTTWWQKTHVIADKRVAMAAKALDVVERPAIDAKRALELAKAVRFAPTADEKPLALLALVDPRLLPPLWGAQAGAKRALIHAETGQVLLSDGGALDVVLDVIRKLPKVD